MLDLSQSQLTFAVWKSLGCGAKNLCTLRGERRVLNWCQKEQHMATNTPLFSCNVCGWELGCTWMWRPEVYTRNCLPLLFYLICWARGLSTQPGAWQRWLARPENPISPSETGITGRPSHPASMYMCFWGSELGSSCLLKPFNHWAISQPKCPCVYTANSFPKVGLVMGIHQTQLTSVKWDWQVGSPRSLPLATGWRACSVKSYHWASAICSRLLASGRDLEVKPFVYN